MALLKKGKKRKRKVTSLEDEETKMQPLSNIFCSNLHSSGQNQANILQNISIFILFFPPFPPTNPEQFTESGGKVSPLLLTGRAGRAGCNYAQNQRRVTALINGNKPYQSNGATLQKQLRLLANHHQRFLLVQTVHFQGLGTIIHSSLCENLPLRQHHDFLPAERDDVERDVC